MRPTYFKRFRMELDLPTTGLQAPAVPAGYRVLAWDADLLETHARVKYLAFRDEIDAAVFPCFTELVSCKRLMRQIVQKEGFLPEATWLGVYVSDSGQLWEPCGTIQGVRDEFGLGSIQNLGVVPEHRNRGLGTCLLGCALDGFRRAGLGRVHLEVTAENHGAVRMYESMGFRVVKTLYKPAEVSPQAESPNQSRR